MMRQSRQSSAISQTQKLKYPKCQRKKQHSKQTLNFICLTQTCKLKGLICVMCKTSDHVGHNILPLKTFLIKMQETLKKIQSKKQLKIEQNESIKEHRNLLQKLEDVHIQILSTLKIQLEQISSKIQLCQQQILLQYTKSKQKISSQFQKQILISKSLQQIQIYLTDQKDKQQSFDIKMNILKLLSLIKIEKNDILVQNQAQSQYNSYLLAANSFKTNMLIWQKETLAIIGQIFKIKPQYQLKETKIRPTTAIDMGSKISNISFSSQLKTESIQLSNENKIAKVKDQKGGKVILLTEKASDWKNIPIKFKISNLSAASSIQIGLCLKSQVIQKLYKFEKNNLQHGYYVYSSNGFVYSSNDDSVNNTKWALTYKTGDQLTLQIDQKDNKITLKKKNETKHYSISLKHLNQNQWKDLYICVSLNGKDDKIQILP